MLTQQMALNLFEYKEGDIYWNINKPPRLKIGDKAGSFDKQKGYFRVGINGKDYYVHRIIFLMHYGFIPKIIDHIDQNKQNNKIENLREVTKAGNQYNSKSMVNNTTGCKNVYWCKRSKRYIIKFVISGKQKQCGVFNSIDDAKKEADLLRLKFHGDFASC